MKFQLLIKAKMLKNNDFSCYQTFSWSIYPANKIVGILTFMSWINFVLSCVEHENSFITLGLMTDHPSLKTDVSDDGILCITCYSAQHFKIFLFGNMRKDLNGTYKKAIVPICKNRILDFWDCFEKEKSVLTKPFSCPNVIFMQFASNPPSSS